MDNSSCETHNLNCSFSHLVQSDNSSKGGFFRSLFSGGASKAKQVVNIVKHDSSADTTVVPKITKKKDNTDIVNIKVTALPRADVSQLQEALQYLPEIPSNNIIRAAESSQDLSNSLAYFVDTITQLRTVSNAALGHHKNILALTDFFVAILRSLDALSIDPEHCSIFRSLQPYINDATEMAKASCQPGWLARMARSEAMHVEFTRLHLSSIALLRSKNFDGYACTIPARYRDHGQQVKKLLKNMGDGSLDQGLILLRCDEEAQQKIADILDLPVEEVNKDACLEASIFAGTELITDTAARHSECQRVFIEYITTSNDRITADGFQQLLVDMGLMDCTDNFNHPAVARAALVDADSDFDGALSFDEFCSFYLRYPIAAIRLQIRTLMGLKMERRIYDVFAAFAAFGAGKKITGGGSNNAEVSELGLDCLRFAKLCRDSDLFHNGMAPQHVDVIFTSAKPRDARRMNFDTFLCALGLIAMRQGQTLERIARLVAMAGGPAMRATKAGFIKLHDDKSMFTGVYARGGPSIGPVNLDLQTVVARTKDPPHTPRQPSGEVPLPLPPTRPESPVLMTKHRVNISGPSTPGRGAPLLATEARAAARAAAAASPQGPPAVFGRTITPRAAAMAQTPRGRSSAFGRTLPTPRSGVKKSLIPAAPPSVASTSDSKSVSTIDTPTLMVSMIPPAPMSECVDVLAPITRDCSWDLDGTCKSSISSADGSEEKEMENLHAMEIIERASCDLSSVEDLVENDDSEDEVLVDDQDEDCK